MIRSTLPGHGRRGVLMGVVAVALMAALGVFGGRWWVATGDDVPSVVEEIGTTVSGASTEGPRSTGVLSTPDVSVQLDVTEPTTSAVVSGELRRAPDGAVFLGIRSTPDRWSTTRFGTYVEERTVFTLIAGGRRSELDVDSLSQVVTVIAGDGRDAVVEAAFAGRVQTLHPWTGRVDAGDFTSFYERHPSPGCAPTASSRIGRLLWVAPCEVGAVFEAGWAPGVGWAPSGRRWLVVEEIRVFVREAHWRGSPSGPVDETYHDMLRGTGSVKVDGRAPLSTDGYHAAANPDLRAYVFEWSTFEVPVGGPTTLEVGARLTLGDEYGRASDRTPGAPEEVTATVRQSVRMDLP